LIDLFLRITGVYKLYEKYLDSQINKSSLPNHIGLILDGNRRWANHKSAPYWLGHIMGAEIVEKLLEWVYGLGIKTITLYVLSIENLQRNPKEVQEIMELIEQRLQKLLNDTKIHSEQIKIKSLGRTQLLSEEMKKTLSNLENVTENYDNHYLNIAIAYGGRVEIVDAIFKIVDKVQKGKIDPKSINQKTVEEHLYTSHLKNPDPDLIIRTSGEERLSGFLLWQSAYSELIFLDVYWPDFRKIDLMRAIRTYQKRYRRFGK
jgi:tritrans,polycis-undecaprenyl-diphosphate synthase [geranylgeranyl-diphosphate specific]